MVVCFYLEVVVLIIFNYFFRGFKLRVSLEWGLVVEVYVLGGLVKGESWGGELFLGVCGIVLD